MAAWLEERGAEIVVCAGYMHLSRRRPPRPLPRERIVNSIRRSLP